MKHARLSPSSSSRWLSCTASVEASEGYEDKGNSAATWGTQTHFIGERLLTGHTVNVGDKLHEEGQSPFTVEEEQLECAVEYQNYVSELIGDESVVIIEEQYDLSCIAPEQFGTSDATVLNGDHLHIVDLKTGHNVVMAENNSQMMLYAIGAVEELGDIYDINTITLHICQTRAGHVDEWTLSYDELMTFKNFAQQQAHAILEGDVQFKPTEKGCQWCSHAVNCEALNKHVNDTVKGEFENLEEVEGHADLISDEHIAKLLKNEALIVSFLKAVKDVALERAMKGQAIDGHKLVRGTKNLAWTDKEHAEKYLVRKLKQEGAFKRTLITPTQAKKALGKDGMKFIEKLSARPEGDIKLVPNSAKGEAIDLGEDFKDLS